MTALKEFERLEAAGLWRADAEAQRRDVIISVGDATLTISDMNDRPLAHWSLAALERANPGEYPALFHPDGDPGETLEIGADETTMLEAIARVQAAIGRSRPRPGRLRALSGLGMLALFLALAVLWLPGAVSRHAVSVVPEIKRKAVGRALLERIERVSGPACATPEAAPILRKLAQRTGVRRLAVLRSGVPGSLHLPGGIVLLNRSFVEDYEDPAVAAGAILAERARAAEGDPMAALLDAGGLAAPVRLLTTGDVNRATLDAYAEAMLASPRPVVPPQVLLAEFARAGLPSAPYAYALDITGETVLPLIEGDPMAGQEVEPVLSDRDWVRLQNICG
ncbi:hypothetical protein [Cribrihabitans pelagius]|uniref:hypothetical protein n=1 Tax=Cribrihabitans pelagius TaxID=1765746 RepID=UPI003B5A2458